jgi:thymidylate kinase
MTAARLIAVDGADGHALLEQAERLARGLGVKGVSSWDASGLFEQLLAAEEEIVMSPRLLLLLYAADLAFRLRWEVEPALAEGRDVVAAPYVETAIAFGRACGVPAKWLRDLFRFARKANKRNVVSGAPSKLNPTAGFIEFAATQLPAGGSNHGRVVAVRTGRHFGRSSRAAR